MKGPTPAQVARAAIRRWGFAEFCRQAWPIVEPGTPCLWNWHHDAICEALDAVAHKRCRNLIINVPPGCTKTTIVTKMWPAYLWALDPAERILTASYDQGLMIAAAGHTRGSLRLITSPWYKALFPHVQVQGDDKAAEGNHDTSKLGFRFSTSIGGRVTGRHGTVKIVDDPQKPQSATKVGLENTWNWYRATWSSRNAAADTRQVIIMQRIAQDDLVGRLLEEEGDAWTLLKIPMEYREGAPLLPFGKDPRTVKGELLWPARYPQSEVWSLRRSLGPLAASAQLDQDPTPEGGTVFQRDWFPRFEGHDLPAVLDKVFLSLDAAFKGAETSDRVAWTVWGQKGPRLFLLGAEARQRSFLETLSDAQRLVQRWRPDEVLIEDKANGPAICEVLRRSIPGVLEVSPGADSKIARAHSVSGYCQAGDVAIPSDRLAPWAGEWLDELTRFPRGRYDDLVDSTSQALQRAFRDSTVGAGLAAESDLVRQLYGF